MRYQNANLATASRPGVALPAVLVVVALLALAAYQFSESMSAEFHAAESFRRSAQVRALADSGVHYAAALLATSDNVTNLLNNNPYSNSGRFQGIQVTPDGPARVLGRFCIVAPV